MRWKSTHPDIGDTRKREGFLWWPKTINGETRWLERARWQECYGKYHPTDDDVTGLMKGLPGLPEEDHWNAFRWLPMRDGKPDPPYKRPSCETAPEPPIIRPEKPKNRRIRQDQGPDTAQQVDV